VLLKGSPGESIPANYTADDGTPGTPGPPGEKGDKVNTVIPIKPKQSYRRANPCQQQCSALDNRMGALKMQEWKMREWTAGVSHFPLPHFQSPLV